MTALSNEVEKTFPNPLDVIEQIATSHDWLFERSSDRDIAVEVNGHWCDYRMFVSWHEDVHALLFACAFDMRVPDRKGQKIYPLLSLINERLLVGHFDLWHEDGLPVFRHALLLRGVTGVSREQLEDVVDIAFTESERYYPAFQFVIWGGKEPEVAMAAAILETAGEA
ncbi:MAG: YbjN domain-containing protein [Pseudomonadota bacterium]|nr:YbjN domain-containing protein [Pseudomonadota bacterium]